MMLLDTNIISELFKPRPNAAVVNWVAALSPDELFTTAITRGELLFGVYCMPQGRRRHDLLHGLETLFELRLAGHVLAYDGAAAGAYAAITADRRKHGFTSSQADAMIAGIAHSRGATLATRNVRDFKNCGVELVNPWV